MSHSILKAMLILPLLAAGAHSAKSASVESSEVYGYWNDEAAGGGSYLGVDTSDITADRVGPLHLKEERGVEVTMVDQDAPAGKAGVREHDVILSVNGEPIQGVEQLRRMIHEVPPGRTVSLGISRNGQAMTLQAQLARRQDFSLSAPEFKFVMPQLTTLPELDIPASIVVVHSSGRSGLMVEDLSPQLSEFFGAKDGILVRSVEKGSSADKAGFRAGDVIVRVNGQAVNDSGDFGQAIRNRKGNTVTIGIVRGRKEQTLTLTLPEFKHTGFDNLGMEEIGTRSEKEVSELEQKLAQIKPQTELAIRKMKQITPEIERKLEELCQQEAQFKDQMERMQQDQKRELLDDLDKLQAQPPQQLRQSMGHQADI